VHRSPIRTLVLLAGLLLAGLTACGGGSQTTTSAAAEVLPATTIAQTGGTSLGQAASGVADDEATDEATDEAADEGLAAEAPATTTTTTLPVSPLAALVRPLPSAEYDPTEHDAAIPPVRVTVEGIGATDVVIRSVGLQPSGEMEIPPATEVGWYRLSVTPGDPGSSVLAGHIAYNGTDGAFYRLDEVAVGALVEVDLADGTTRSFRVTAVEQFRKDALPETLFRTEGDPVLTLITCGGTFQPSVRSYDSNIVVTAVPV